MNIAITGASGLIGSPLVRSLEADGHGIIRLKRRRASEAGTYAWDPEGGAVDAAAFDDCDAVVHLAGENIASHRWSDAQKARIRDSRVLGTRTICRAIADVSARPGVLVSASAVGYYGDRGDQLLTESSAPGEGYLPEVCVAWEDATQPAADAGVRVVCLRTGMVLSTEGGALAKMLTPFKLGAGGVLGSGKQYMSWIDCDDLVGVIRYAIETESLSGALNATAPDPVTNREFTKTLGKVLGRPTIFPMPAFAAKAVFGEMADALLLSSARAIPERLLESGHTFRYPKLEVSLRHQLGR